MTAELMELPLFGHKAEDLAADVSRLLSFLRGRPVGFQVANEVFEFADFCLQVVHSREMIKAIDHGSLASFKTARTNYLTRGIKSNILGRPSSPPNHLTQKEMDNIVQNSRSRGSTAAAASSFPSSSPLCRRRRRLPLLLLPPPPPLPPASLPTAGSPRGGASAR